MCNKEIVSIIVSVYNVEEYIGECIKSLTGQTYSDIEIILVDDGTKDSSGQICDEWVHKDNRIKVFHKLNGGLSDARNYGISRATGEYICFVDGDDCLESTFVEVMLNHLKTDNADLCVCHYYQNDLETGEYVYSKVYSDEVKSVDWQRYMEIVYNNAYYATACIKLGKKNLYTDNMFPVGKKHEDAFVILDTVRRCKNICIIPDHLYFYRNRPDSIMNYTDERLYLDDFGWIKSHIDKLEQTNCDKLLFEAKKLFCHNFIKNYKFIGKKNQKNIKKIYNKYYSEIIFSGYMTMKSRIKYMTVGLLVRL